MNKRIDFSALALSVLPPETRKYVLRLTKMRDKMIDDTFNPDEAVCEYKVNKNEELLTKIILYNLPMAVILVKRYASYVHFSNVSDMLSVALETIVRCANNYDPGFSTKFSTYLVVTMRGEILKYIDNARSIKFTYHYHKHKINPLNENEVLSAISEPIIDNNDNISGIQVLTHTDITQLLDSTDSIEGAVETYAYIHSDGSYVQTQDNDRKISSMELISNLLTKCIEDIKANTSHNIERLIIQEIENSLNNSTKYTIAYLYRKYNLERRHTYLIYSKIIKRIRDCLICNIKNDKDLINLMGDYLLIDEK